MPRGNAEKRGKPPEYLILPRLCHFVATPHHFSARIWIKNLMQSDFFHDLHRPENTTAIGSAIGYCPGTPIFTQCPRFQSLRTIRMQIPAMESIPTTAHCPLPADPLGHAVQPRPLEIFSGHGSERQQNFLMLAIPLAIFCPAFYPASRTKSRSRSIPGSVLLPPFISVSASTSNARIRLAFSNPSRFR